MSCIKKKAIHAFRFLWLPSERNTLYLCVPEYTDRTTIFSIITSIDQCDFFRGSYKNPVWHYSLIKDQSQQIERIQKRAIHIILNFSRGMPYISMLFDANVETLASRRDDLFRGFFLDIAWPSSCLHCFLPAPREQSVISRLRTSAKFSKVYTRTKGYCSY